MKNIVSLLLVVIALQSNAICAQQQSTSAEDSVSVSKRQYLLVDITGYPMTHNFSRSWDPYRSVRIGYGREIEDLLELRVYAEYIQSDFDTNDPMSDKIYSPGIRRDIAIYAAIVAFRFVEIALGGYYKTQDEVVRQVLHSDPPPPVTTVDPAVNKFGVYMHFGLSGSFHIYGPVNIGLGIFIRHELNEGVDFGCRAGLKFEI